MVFAKIHMQWEPGLNWIVGAPDGGIAPETQAPDSPEFAVLDVAQSLVVEVGSEADWVSVADIASTTERGWRTVQTIPGIAGLGWERAEETWESLSAEAAPTRGKLERLLSFAPERMVFGSPRAGME